MVWIVLYILAENCKTVSLVLRSRVIRRNDTGSQCSFSENTIVGGTALMSLSFYVTGQRLCHVFRSRKITHRSNAGISRLYMCKKGLRDQV